MPQGLSRKWLIISYLDLTARKGAQGSISGNNEYLCANVASIAMANMIPDRIFNLAFEEYISEKNVVIEDSRILQDFNNEVSTQKEYRGREIFELIQNADDQAARKMVIILDTKNHVLTVSNDGDKPFTEAGFRSIMRANNSSKPLENLIGQKGLGFRSILNWAKEIEIHSAGVVCKFSSGIADKKWEQIKKAYLAKLSETV